MSQPRHLLTTVTLFCLLALPGYAQDSLNLSIASFARNDWAGGICGLAALNDSFLLADIGGHGYAVIDVSDPANMVQVDTLMELYGGRGIVNFWGADYTQPLARLDTLFYLERPDDYSAIVNLADPATPEILSYTSDLPSDFSILWNEIESGRLINAYCSGHGGAGIMNWVAYTFDLYDLSDPVEPSLIRSYEYAHGDFVIEPLDAAAWDSTLYVLTTDFITKLDGDLGDEELLYHEQPIWETPTSITVRNTILFWHIDEQGLLVYDIADFANWELLDSIPDPPPFDQIHVIGDTLYYGNRPAYNVNNPLSLVPLETPGPVDSANWARIGNTVFTSSEQPPTIQAFDVSDPEEPVLVGSLSREGHSYQYGAFINHTLYVANDAGQIEAWNVTDPYAPQYTGVVLDSLGRIDDLTAWGCNLIVTHNPTNYHVYSFDLPFHAIDRGEWEFPEQVGGEYVKWDWLRNGAMVVGYNTANEYEGWLRYYTQDEEGVITEHSAIEVGEVRSVQGMQERLLLYEETEEGRSSRVMSYWNPEHPSTLYSLQGGFRHAWDSQGFSLVETFHDSPPGFPDTYGFFMSIWDFETPGQITHVDSISLGGNNWPSIVHKSGPFFFISAGAALREDYNGRALKVYEAGRWFHQLGRYQPIYSSHYDIDLAYRDDLLCGVADNRIWLLDAGNMFYVDAPEGESSETDLVLPRECVLEPAYPNPFNPSTTLQYVLPQTMEIELVVYDLLGREVVRLAEGMQDPARHTVTWRGCDASGRPVASGTYLVRLKTQQKQAVEKVVLVK